MTRDVLRRLLCAVGALTLIAALTPFTAGAANAAADSSGPSISDPRITLCHRTNAESNPYVQITVAKPAVFKQGHDTHAEGGVWQSGDKAAGTRWGDIIPAFDYYASPQDENTATVSHYAGSNSGAGADFLATGCKAPAHEHAPDPQGALDGECTDAGNVLLSGSLDADGAQDIRWRLLFSTGQDTVVSGNSFEKTTDAPAGTTVALQFQLSDGWTDTGDSLTVKDCPAPDRAVTPVAPDVEQSACKDGAATPASYTVKETEGVEYLVGDARVTGTVEVQAGTTVVVTARATAGHTLEGDRSFRLEFAAAPACEGPPVQQHHPTGSLSGACADKQFVVTGAFDSDEAHDVSWRLHVVPGTNIDLTTSPFSVAVAAAPGATVTLEQRVGDGDWSTADGSRPVTVRDCDKNPTGTISGSCVDGRFVVRGTFDSDGAQQIRWRLHLSGGTDITLTASPFREVIDAPAGSTVTLQFAISERPFRDVEEVVVTNCPPPVAVAPSGTIEKTAVPASGSIVDNGQLVTYTVVVRNTGTVRIVGGPAVDTLPPHVSLVAGSVTGGGVPSADGRSITWTVTLDRDASATFTFQVRVDADAPAGSVLVNRVTFLQAEARTTHTVGNRSLSVVKSVDRAHAQFGDTLTYTLLVSAGGSLGQTGVVVTDFIPGHRPGRPSGTTTYVDGTATCQGTCTVTFDKAAQLLTWQLGDMAPGTTRTLTFQVTIDRPAAGPEGGIPGVTILNSAAVQSAQTPATPSNEVTTEVIAVKGVKVGPPATPPASPPQAAGPPRVLPRTGGPDMGRALAGAAVLVLTGLVLVEATRRRRPGGRRG